MKLLVQRDNNKESTAQANYEKNSLNNIWHLYYNMHAFYETTFLILHIYMNILSCVPKYFPRKTNTLVGLLWGMILPAMRKVRYVLYEAIEISSSSSSSLQLHFSAGFSHDVLASPDPRRDVPEEASYSGFLWVCVRWFLCVERVMTDAEEALRPQLEVSSFFEVQD
jgi:hypothetical protein